MGPNARLVEIFLAGAVTFTTAETSAAAFRISFKTGCRNIKVKSRESLNKVVVIGAFYGLGSPILEIKGNLWLSLNER